MAACTVALSVSNEERSPCTPSIPIESDLLFEPWRALKKGKIPIMALPSLPQGTRLIDTHIIFRKEIAYNLAHALARAASTVLPSAMEPAVRALESRIQCWRLATASKGPMEVRPVRFLVSRLIQITTTAQLLQSDLEKLVWAKANHILDFASKTYVIEKYKVLAIKLAEQGASQIFRKLLQRWNWNQEIETAISAQLSANGFQSYTDSS